MLTLAPLGAQIELEKTRLEEAADEDPDIAEALEELRSQLDESKRDKLSQLQALEQAERSLATEVWPPPPPRRRARRGAHSPFARGALAHSAHSQPAFC